MRDKGYVINHKTIQKLMKQLGLKGKQRKNDKYHSYKGTVGKVADNLLKRDFYAEKPFEKITTDVTQFNVCDEKVYLSPVLDLFNNEVVSYSVSTSPNLEQTGYNLSSRNLIWDAGRVGLVVSHNGVNDGDHLPASVAHGRHVGLPFIPFFLEIKLQRRIVKYRR